ncbi:GDSL family lipase [Pedobacter sp. BS3]|uniref:GDSL-type esterase/lipase family protein n=1 Tax=Pedobacter sp. BS3 TaxID=2567937 RepID=UPI0011EDD485|nr:GDSL-type esterase/lipase family protein [Pedobacter sp. BS3]TZF81835.1 GDSL family lipase [Pedobacter sp. BS3]
MKYYKINLLLLFLGLSSAYGQNVAIDSSYANSHYKQRLDFFRQMPNQKKEIVFLGNSITEGGKWQELVPLKHVINRGISGDVTYGVIARLDEVLASKPAKIFLLIGVNDMKRGIPNEIIAANYLRIIKIVQSQSPRTKLFMQSVLPVNQAMLPASYAQVTNEKINDLNNRLKLLCDTYKLKYIDLHPAFENAQGEMRKELTLDGLHLRSASYILWADYLRKIHAI